MVNVECLPQFKILYDPPQGTNLFILIGGRGGAKTYEASKYAAVMSTIKGKRTVILRDEKSLIKDSILNEVLLRFDTANSNGTLGRHYERLDTGIKSRRTNEMMVFTKGFRASTLEKKANLKSLSNIDIAMVEEAEDIRNEEQFNTFADSIRNQDSVIVIILNTPDINHWILKRYFNLEQVEDGYWKIIPKSIPGFVCIHTGYEDNPYLPEHVRARYDAYGDERSHLYNKHYFYTAIKGYASAGRKGQVFTKFKTITMRDYLDLKLPERYGQDFGTASPAGTIGAKLSGNNVYAREINYKPATCLQLGKMYSLLQLPTDAFIIADSADRDSVIKLRMGWTASELDPADVIAYPLLLRGWNVYGARKGDGSVRFGIDSLGSKNVFIVEESINFWNEIRNYVYAVDRNFNPTDQPIDDFNHLIDPLRYVDEAYGRIF